MAGRCTRVYKVGVAPTEYIYIYRAHEAFIEVATRSTAVYKVGVASAKYQAHEACTSKDKVGEAFIGIVLSCTCYWYIYS